MDNLAGKGPMLTNTKFNKVFAHNVNFEASSEDTDQEVSVLSQEKLAHNSWWKQEV